MKYFAKMVIGSLIAAHAAWSQNAMIILIAIVVLACTLSGCATTQTVVPPSLLQCADQPRSPAADPNASQADVGIYVIDLAEAGADCRSKLGSVRTLLMEPVK